MFKITFLNTVYQTKGNETVCKIQYRVHHNKDTESQILEASGKSKCCPKDTFNAEVGKAIAKARAEIKARDNVIKQFKGPAYVIRKKTDELDTAICAFTTHNEHDNAYINFLDKSNNSEE